MFYILQKLLIEICGNKTELFKQIHVLTSQCLKVHRARYANEAQVQLVHPFQSSMKAAQDSLLSNWEIVFNPPDKFHPYFCDSIPFQGVQEKSDIHSHLYHFQGSP